MVKLLNDRIPENNRDDPRRNEVWLHPNALQLHLHPLQRDLVVPPEGSPLLDIYHLLMIAAVTAEIPANVHLQKPAEVSAV